MVHLPSHGITAEKLCLIDAQRTAFLPFKVLQQGETSSIAIDLDTTTAECEIVMCTPRIYPLARFDGRWKGSDILVSLSTGHWRSIKRLPG